MNYKDFRKINKPKESQIQTEIKNCLLTKGYYVMRLNSGRIRTEKGLVKLQDAGTPDLMAFKIDDPGFDTSSVGVDLLFVEVKTPTNKTTRLQELKMEELTRYGARCIVAHSVDDIMAVL